MPSRRTWFVGLLWLLTSALIGRTSGADTLQVYLIVSSLLAVWTCVYRPVWVGLKPQKRTGLSAYAFCNPHNEKLLGDTTLSSFGIRDVSAQQPTSSSLALPPRLSALTETQKQELARAKLKLHQKCWCGSGRRFAACCESLQRELRQLGYHDE